MADARENLRKAAVLCNEILDAGLPFGCIEVAMQALGAPMHYVDILYREEKGDGLIVDHLERHGLHINWTLAISPTVTAEMMMKIFEGDLLNGYMGNYPTGIVTGYLGLELYQDQGRPDHAIAILPRDTMPRDTRHSLKKKNAYAVVDTLVGKPIMVTAKNLAIHAAQISENGGMLQISQIRKPARH